MKRRSVILFLTLAVLFVANAATDSLSAQRYRHQRGVRSMRWGVDSQGDSILYISLLDVNVYHRMRDLKEYQRMVNAVKKVYPLAIEAARRMENLDQELERLGKRKDRKAYTRAIEDALKEEISPVLWKMTRY